MLTAKRVLIATVCGFICGLFCLYLASSNPNAAEPISTTTKWMILLSRTMLGFTIGISALRLRWWQHGIVLGFICSIPMAIPVLHDPKIGIGTLVLGMIYGLLTEWVTTKLFKAKAVGAQ
jgi:hypothetical protein